MEDFVELNRFVCTDFSLKDEKVINVHIKNKADDLKDRIDKIGAVRYGEFLYTVKRSDLMYGGGSCDWVGFLNIHVNLI